MGDIDRPFRDVCALSDKPLYAPILDIQRCGYSSEGKTLKWRFVKESRKRRYDADDEKIELCYVEATAPFIAVSCPWHLPASESSAVGKYHIERGSNMKIEIPQDVVLDRVIKFASFESQRLKASCPFWIDRLCIDQEEKSDEKEVAIQSMDLVYKHSNISLGLLFVRLDLKEQVKRLHALLRGWCAAEGGKDRDGNVKYILTTDINEARAVLRIIRLIVEDVWWDRAWIFQEEYLSQLRMRLLIRSLAHYGHRKILLFSDVTGELQVRAAAFRTKATTFCLAFLQHTRVSEDEKRQCLKILERTGKYNVLLTRNGTLKTLEAMSPVIFKDIGKRGISQNWDILPIASNTCDYSMRLDTRKLQKQPQEDGKSLSLAILTTYILNGEILRHESKGKGLVGNVFEFLNDNTLRIEPPLGKEKGLTFIKHCRFSSVTLSAHGMETEGVIWKLRKVINIPPQFRTLSTSAWLRSNIEKHGPRRTSGFGYHLDHSELIALWRLLGWLRYQGYSHLVDRLSRFLEDIAPEGYSDDWTYRHIMSIMATNVARAIQENRKLQLGCIDRNTDFPTSPYCAIFVRDAINSDDWCSAFTSWTCAEEVVERDLLATSCAKYASLETTCSESNHRWPTIKPRQWINGLCFFNNKDAMRVQIPWPEWFRG